MAGCDYANCDYCGKRAFYDANVDWKEWGENLGLIRIMCKECWIAGNRYGITVSDSRKHNPSIYFSCEEGRAGLNFTPADPSHIHLCDACGYETVSWDEYKNHFHFCGGEDE